jgi:hypothetical protein
MRAFVSAEPHLCAMARIDHWCDEAAFALWEQDTEGLPGWQTAYRHLVVNGYSAALTHASDRHQARSFPRPVESI